MEYALERREQALEFACRFGSGARDHTQVNFVDKFANRDTVCMPEDVREGLWTLYHEAFRAGLIDHEPPHEIV
jgi:predicted solute-binding protein